MWPETGRQWTLGRTETGQERSPLAFFRAFQTLEKRELFSISLPVRLAQDCMRQSFFDLDFDMALLVCGAVRLHCKLRKGRCVNLALTVNFRK
jgi:hypothetical protein